MEEGFFHQDRGYWQTISEPSEDIVASYPEGTLRVPIKPGPHYSWNGMQWIDQRTPETEWPVVRAKRNQLLTATDWTQLPDVPLATKEAWATYRQALRDITQQADPFNIVWPVPPAEVEAVPVW